MKKERQDSGKYIRVGTTLYKTVRRPLISGDYLEDKIVWSYETMRRGYGKNNLPEIEVSFLTSVSFWNISLASKSN